MPQLLSLTRDYAGFDRCEGVGVNLIAVYGVSAGLEINSLWTIEIVI